ncbi:MAG TPA: hypothetical protein VMF86_12720, partial [Stellaceae bacterium]|nr:hypothetical protein [Stellaceae bacterium]
PEELFRTLDPNLGRFQSVDRALCDLFHAIPTPWAISASIWPFRSVGSKMEALEIGSRRRIGGSRQYRLNHKPIYFSILGT